MSLSFGRFRQRRRRNLAIVTGIMCLIAAALVWSSAPARRGAAPLATAQPSPRIPAAATTAATPTPTVPTGLRRLQGATPGPISLAAPLLTMGRPFAGDGLGLKAAPSYPYGTTGGGAYILHHGLDFGNPQGSPVRAVAAGEVVFAGIDSDGEVYGASNEPFPEGFYGRLVVIRHPLLLDGQPLYSLYGHLSRLRVARRQHVKAGDAIGAVGMAGIALGPHLHLEIRDHAQDYGRTYNPDLFLTPLAGEGLIVGRVSDPAGKAMPK
ncbi:MAG TPA: M23 family metallopeptidase, partial [Anaerolineae bacterium]|nr:M23 family metallopeptidase [Anaerolineae bacterium]